MLTWSTTKHMKHLPLAHDYGSSFGVNLRDEAKLQPITVWVGIQVSGLNPATSTPLNSMSTESLGG